MGQDAVDVLIVGAGASGAAVAYSLADMGLKILCLEQGDWVDRSNLPSTRKDYELHRYDKFSCDPNVRKLPQDYPINSENSAITPVNYNAVGGSTINYLGHWPRFPPSDFRVKTSDGVADMLAERFKQYLSFFNKKNSQKKELSSKLKIDDGSL